MPNWTTLPTLAMVTDINSTTWHYFSDNDRCQIAQRSTISGTKVLRLNVMLDSLNATTCPYLGVVVFPLLDMAFFHLVEKGTRPPDGRI